MNEPFTPTPQTAVGGGQFLDPSEVWLPNPPREWEAIPPEILARLAPQMVSHLPIPGPYGIDRRTGRRMTMPVYNNGTMLTPQQRHGLDRLAQGRWFLLRNDGPVMEKARCKRCGALHAYFTLACVERPFHGLQELQGLLETHKDGYRILDGFRLGTIEPITRAKALALAEKIRGRGERLG